MPKTAHKHRDFDKAAKTWDEEPRRVKLAQSIARAVIGRVPLNRRMDVLDFGCGTGLVSLPLSRKVKSVTGADTSSGMIGILKKKIRHEKIANVRAVHLNRRSKTVPKGRYHGVVSSMTFHHIPDVAPLLRRFCMMLHPGGWIAVADLDEDQGHFHEDKQGVFHHGFDRAHLKKLFVEAGFKNVRVRTATKVKKATPQGRLAFFPVFLMTGIKELTP